MMESKGPILIGNNVKIKVLVNCQCLTLNIERTLMPRFSTVARISPDIDLPGYFGTYEFFIVPKSLFTADGNLHNCIDKAGVAYNY